MKTIALSLGLLLLSASAPVASSPWKAGIALDRSDYVAGEPMLLLVGIRNVTADTLTSFSPRISPCSAVFLEIQGGYGLHEYRAIWKSVPTKQVLPGDSVRFYVPIEVQGRRADSLGNLLPDRGFPATFRNPGRYSIRLHLYLPGQRGPAICSSNTIGFLLRKPTRADERLIDALWKAHVVGASDFFWNCEPEARVVPLRPENEGLLRRAAARSPTNRLVAHVRFALAAFAGSDWRYRSVMLRSFADEYPAYWPAVVAQHYALSAIAAAELQGAWGDLEDASRVIEDALSRDPGLREDPEFMLAFNRVHERDGDLEVHLTASSRTCVVGEPMLFRVSFFNTSRYALQVIGSDGWDPGETFNGQGFGGYLEIEDQSGRRKRWTEPQSVQACGIRITGYRGIPLAPGDSVTFTWSVDRTVEENKGDARGDLGPLFRAPGRYRVRVGYRVAGDLWRLSGRGRDLLSLPVSITVKGPDPVGEKILAALPHQSLFDASEKVQTIQQLLNTYPRHELATHLRLAMARDLRSGRNHDRDRAFTLFEQAREGTVGLWRDEITRQQADLYRWPFDSTDSPESRRCRDRIVALMRDNPGLWTDDDFSSTAVLLVFREYGEAASDARSYWQSRMYVAGTSPPSWRALREAAEQAASRRAFVGPQRKHEPVTHRKQTGR